MLEFEQLEPGEATEPKWCFCCHRTLIPAAEVVFQDESVTHLCPACWEDTSPITLEECEA